MDHPPEPAAAPAPTRYRELVWRILAAVVLLYVFLLSIKLMGGAFKLFGRDFAEGLMRETANPLVGLFIGVFATSLIQSSSTTTSLIVGFVGGGMPLSVAIPMIMGANIGTSVTNTMVSLGFVARKEDFRRAFAGATVHDFFNLLTVLLCFPLEVAFGLLEWMSLRLTDLFSSAGGVTFTSPLKAIIKPASKAVIGLATDTLGLSDRAAGILLVVVAAAVLIASLIFLVRNMRVLVVERAERVVNRYLFRNDLTALLLGLALTVVAQSSSVTTSLIVPLVGAGIVSLARCYPFTLGANLGTTCTALLASLATVTVDESGTAMTLGVTAAFAHLSFNLLGIAVWYPLRRVPLAMAHGLARLAAESKRWAVIFVLLTFFGVPLLMILASRYL
jgi:sodium-dependent phosphate cotransporter